MSRSPGKFVDLAALSMSGSLTPSIPVQVLLKYNPPKVTIVYHFENKVNDQYYHDIPFDQNMLENETVEDIVSHLYMSEAYYFNPKFLKRHQVARLVDKLKNSLGMGYSNSKSPERVSIHGNSPSPVRGRHSQGAMGNYGNIVGSQSQTKYNNHNISASGSSGNSQSTQASINSNLQNQNSHFLGGNIDGIPMGNRSPPRTQNSAGSQNNNPNWGDVPHPNNMPNLENQNQNYNNTQQQQQQNPNANQANGSNSFQQMQQQSAFQRRKNFFERKRFLNYQAHNPMDYQNKTYNKEDGTPSPENNRNGSPVQDNLFEQEVQNAGLIGSSGTGKKLPPLESGAKSNKNQRNTGPGAAASAAHDRVPIEAGQKKGLMSNERIQNSYNQQGVNNNMNINDNNLNENQFNNSDPYMQNENIQNYDQNQQNQSNQMLNSMSASQNEGSQPSINSNNTNQNQGENGNDEQVSVYLKDNMIMRRIQIEGDDREFLMDPQGQIFDMNGQFIGTANTNELEELQEDSTNNAQNQNNVQETDGSQINPDGTLQQNDDLNEASRQFHGNDGGNNQEEELLDDDEDMDEQQF